MTNATQLKRKYKILVVDDEETLRDTIALFLELEGFTVSTAGNAESALQKVKSNGFDLIISDIRMPGGGGLHLLEEVKASTHSPRLIFITGFSDYSDQECMEKGAYKVIRKPFGKTVLIPSVYEALGIH